MPTGGGSWKIMSKMAPGSVTIILAESPEHMESVRTLLQEYWTSFGFTPCFQGFADELARLPGDYAQPGGRLGLALAGDAPVGCVALRRIDAERCEAKRLFVRPQSRGLGIGRFLLGWLINEARAVGYREMLADTMPVMRQALEMYTRAGFERTPPYRSEATPGAIYLRLEL